MHASRIVLRRRCGINRQGSARNLGTEQAAKGKDFLTLSCNYRSLSMNKRIWFFLRETSRMPCGVFETRRRKEMNAKWLNKAQSWSRCIGSWRHRNQCEEELVTKCNRVRSDFAPSQGWTSAKVSKLCSYISSNPCLCRPAEKSAMVEKQQEAASIAAGKCRLDRLVCRRCRRKRLSPPNKHMKTLRQSGRSGMRYEKVKDITWKKNNERNFLQQCTVHDPQPAHQIQGAGNPTVQKNATTWNGRGDESLKKCKNGNCLIIRKGVGHTVKSFNTKLSTPCINILPPTLTGLSHAPLAALISEVRNAPNR